MSSWTGNTRYKHNQQQPTPLHAPCRPRSDSWRPRRPCSPPPPPGPPCPLRPRRASHQSARSAAPPPPLSEAPCPPGHPRSTPPSARATPGGEDTGGCEVCLTLYRIAQATAATHLGVREAPPGLQRRLPLAPRRPPLLPLAPGPPRVGRRPGEVPQVHGRRDCVCGVRVGSVRLGSRLWGVREEGPFPQRTKHVPPSTKPVTAKGTAASPSFPWPVPSRSRPSSHRVAAPSAISGAPCRFAWAPVAEEVM